MTWLVLAAAALTWAMANEGQPAAPAGERSPDAADGQAAATAAIPLADGLSPDEAAQRMTVPDGFSVTLAAGEPQVHQPVAMTIDARGRVWIAEAYNYPLRAPEGQGRDKIRILEDTDGDGTLDHAKTFAEGLNLVSGLEVGFGGVWVGAAPYLMFLPDADGDDRPDGPPQILLDGFAYADTHETLNSFIWGPDGWLYGCQGVFTYSHVGKPGTPDHERTPINAGVWRYHPLRHQFEVFAWGTSNPWGIDFDDQGQAFITACVIPHLFHVIQGARYERQAGQHFNPYVFEDIKTHADHLHYAGNIRDHAWWGQDFLGVNDATSAAGGGHAHCGCMIYLGDNWPDSYRNTLLVCNIHGNRVNREILEPRGSGYVGKHGPDFLMSHDRWFRGINLRYGPDGSVYLIDWYDKNACHRTNSEIWDRTNGRVYNIHYGQRRPVQVDLESMTSAELVGLQRHKNDWYVRTARRILQQRGARPDVHRLLWEMLRSESDPTRQLRALWALHATAGIQPSDWLTLLRHEQDIVRAWAIQLMLEQGAPEPGAWLQALESMARHDPSPRVRLYLASALQKLPNPMRWGIASGLLAHASDADDHNLPLMIWYGLEPLVVADTDRALGLSEASQIPKLARFIVRRAAAEVNDLEPVIARVARQQDEATRQWMLEEIHQALAGHAELTVPANWPETYRLLAQSDNATVRELAVRVAVALGDQTIFPQLRQQLMDSNAEVDARRHALEILVRGRDPQAAEALLGALQVPSLRGPALRALANYDSPQVWEAIVKVYDQLPPEEKRDAIHTLCSRPTAAKALFDAIEQNKIPRSDVHAYDIRQVVEFADEALRVRIENVWGALREADEDKKARIAELKGRLEQASRDSVNLHRGRTLFDKTCANCHMLFGEGGKVGPDLTGSNRANLDYLLENVLDPSAVLGKDYRLTVLELDDGQIISGLVQGETDSAVTIRTVNDTVVVPKSQIAERDLVEKSMMPDGLLETMMFEEIQDLVAYLASPVQVAPLPADAAAAAGPAGQVGETAGPSPAASGP